jgi:very-short-patch-repair endonuclease
MARYRTRFAPPALARRLRRDATLAERRLWRMLRDHSIGVKFCCQHRIDRFIADFAAPEIRLVVELDGGQHADNTDDAARTEILERAGWHVLRFWNIEVLGNIEGVYSVIEMEVKRRKGGIPLK